MKKVCLDPGHGVETPGKRSPDGSYFEHEFTLDMAWRVKALLERHGVAVALTRADERDVTLAQRVKIANAIKDLALFVSLHSNAAGSGGEWKSARGFTVYTSGEGDTAPRNVAARALLARAKEAGVTVRNGGRPNYNGSLYVLHRTNAPACLIEHLFHDNREDVALLKSDSYRQLLAEVDAKGILDFLGVAWQAAPDENTNEKEEKTMTGEEIYYALSDYLALQPLPEWAEEEYAQAVEMGITDGTAPMGLIPRYQAALMAKRAAEKAKGESQEEGR